MIKLNDITIVKNKKTLLYNHKCMVGFNTHTEFYTLYDLETGEIRGQYNSIEEMVLGCKLEISEDKKKDNKQKFELDDVAYMLDDDYRFFDGKVCKIELHNDEYYYSTNDCDFENEDINNWVFKSTEDRESYVNKI